MEIIILVAILIGIPLGFLYEALILHWTTKIFKVENASYKTALRASICFWILAFLVAFVIGILFSAMNVEFFGNIVGIIVGFFIANFLYKKYYQTDTRKNIKMYIVNMLLSSVATFSVAFLVILPIRMFVFQPITMEGASMEPNIKEGQYMFFKEYDKNYQRGEIIVFRYPKNEKQLLLKRIIGLPGEKIEIKDNIIYIDGKVLDESAYLSKEIKTESSISMELANNEYFVMGDNRTASSDSRSWGALKKSLIVGKYWITVDTFSN